MKSHYPLIIAAAEKQLEHLQSVICRDPDNHYFGTPDDQFNNLLEPGAGAALVHYSCVL